MIDKLKAWCCTKHEAISSQISAWEDLTNQRWITMDRVFELRQKNMDQYFAEQKARLEARDREIDLLIQDIPRRVDLAMQNAIAQFVEPYKDLDNELRESRGEITSGEPVFPIDMEEEFDKKIEAAIAKYEI